MLEWFKYRKQDTSATGSWFRAFTPEGVVVRRGRGDEPGTVELSSVEVAPLCRQLEDEGLAQATGDGWLVSWDAAYSIRESSTYPEAANTLGFPTPTSHAPIVESTGSLTDADFAVHVVGWHDGQGRTVHNVELCGAAIRSDTDWGLISREAWTVLCHAGQLRQRTQGQEGFADHRQVWAKIREAALRGNARLDNFLVRSVVLSPDKLEIGLRKAQIGGSKVIEIAPAFQGAPENWLEAFDRQSGVPERYDIPTAAGIVQVLVSPAVRAVLQQIKRMPGRRVAGSRAEAFIANPFAALGDDASNAIDVAHFEREREEKGVIPDTFTARIDSDAFGYPEKVGLAILSSAGGRTSEELYVFSDDGELKQFIDALSAKLQAGMQFCAWQGYDLELMGNSPAELEKLQAAYDTRRRPRVLISHAQVYDLSRYAERVEGIGEEKPYYSPFIARKDDGLGWFPENVVPVICWTPEGEEAPLALPITPDVDKLIRQRLEEAKRTGATQIELPGLSKPLPTKEAQSILGTFDEALADVKKGRFDPEKHLPRDRSKPSRLIGRANIQSIAYQEARRARLLAAYPPARIPAALKTGIRLKDHQIQGLAWLQHLYRESPADCRGAVLADDMGLGKTLQLLCLIASIFEEDSTASPALVVAPLSLLENWAEEVTRFFRDGTLRVLTAYGPGLAKLKISRSEVDERLRGEGLVNFLRPGWRGDAQVVLTTYETLRDLEFSFAAERWSVLVCDEAQRIKNPNALVTRSAKKQNVRFRIACTGTPVENTLADLWCLYDFVQPGLLGALNEFGRRYRKPIEAETEEEKERVQELRDLIKPQILRRMKEDVAKDLPRKTIVEDCRRLSLSGHQRALYGHAVDVFKRRTEPGRVSPFKNHLGLLHYLRLVCTDPRRYGLDVFKPEPITQYREKAPKLDWLLSTLEKIRQRGEKAIVFCEFRNIQRLLAYYIEQAFGFEPDIINGDTAASASHAESRQKRIKVFQRADGFGVLILSPLAVGFGVNIQAANHVIHYTRTWNPAKEDQATDRAYRIGQEREVFVYCPVVCADDFVTFDQKLDQLLERKRELARDMLNGSGDVTPGDFDIGDVVPGGDVVFGEAVTPDDAVQLRWDYFECLIAAVWKRQGFERVYRTPQTDDGIDVVAIAGRQGYLIQCKVSGTADARLGWDAVKDVVTGAASYEVRHPGVAFRKVCATNQYFNATAAHHASLNKVELLDQVKLAELLKTYPVTMSDLEKFLLTDWQAVT